MKELTHVEPLRKRRRTWSRSLAVVLLLLTCGAAVQAEPPPVDRFASDRATGIARVRNVHPGVYRAHFIPDPSAATVADASDREFAARALWTRSKTRRTPYSRIVTIGDSLSDPGNFFALTGGASPPPPYYMGRFSNGPLWTEHLAEALGMELLAEDQYAVGGAFTGSGNLNGPFPGTAEQVQQLLDDHPCGLDRRALFAVWIGANDFFATLGYVNTLDPTAPDYQAQVAAAFTAMVETGVANTVDVVATLAENGARHILVGNLPEMGLTPLGQAGGPETSLFMSYWVDVYNTALDAALDTLAGECIALIRLDSAGLMREMVADPEAFGLVNVTDRGLDVLIGGGDPTGYLFWDDVHPTTDGHAAVADRAVEELLAFYARRYVPRHPRALSWLIPAYEARHTFCCLRMHG